MSSTISWSQLALCADYAASASAIPELLDAAPPIRITRRLARERRLGPSPHGLVLVLSLHLEPFR